MNVRRPALLLILVGFLLSACNDDNNGEGDVTRSQWLFSGHDLHNTRFQNAERLISPNNAAALTVRWQFATDGEVSATPAVDEQAVYIPDWAGNLFAIDRYTGAQRWSRRVGDYTGIADDLARTTPAIAGDKLIFGNQSARKQPSTAWMMAVDKYTGNLLWKTQVDPHPAAIITQAAIVADGVVYVGVSSWEEAYSALVPNYQCCTFRGSMVALDEQTGQILWRWHTVPEGYSGGAIWGSTAVLDRARNSLYVATGNNYTVPEAVRQCVIGAEGSADAQRACISPDNHFDSVVALDPATGAVKWARTVLPFDAWNAGCIPELGNEANCPQPAGPDYDFGQGPALFTVRLPESGQQRDLLGAGQKSGQYWAFDPDTGAVIWSTQVGPGGQGGGLQWGSAVDGQRIYVAVANSENKSWTLVQNGNPTGVTVNSGLWSALDAATGKILWQVADPGIGRDGQPSPTMGPVTAANGVVYACSLDTAGSMYAFDAVTGETLWQYASGNVCIAGAAVADGMVYWGTGYGNFTGQATPGNKFFAFHLSMTSK